MSLKNIFAKNLPFFIPVIIFLLTGIIFFMRYPKDVFHLIINAWYSPFWDVFFRYGTYLGDGLVFFLVPLILMFVRWRYCIGFVATGLVVLLLTSFLKQVVFEGTPRPARYFEGKAELRYVQGLELARHNSFPSGHTTTAFAAWGFIAFIIRSGVWQFICFAGAAIAGYSRMYLSQHFLEDVIAGAFLGTCIAIFGYWLAMQIRGKWADRNLLPKA